MKQNPFAMKFGLQQYKPTNYITILPATGYANAGRAYGTQCPNMTYNIAVDYRWNMQRFEVHPFEYWVTDAASLSERSELTDNQVWAFDKDVWISYSFMVEPGVPVTNPWCVIGQMHNQPDGISINASPPWSLEIDPADQSLVVRTIGSPVKLTTNTAPQTVQLRKTDFQRGRWYSLVCRVVFSHTGAGQIQLWLDGVEQFNRTGQMIGYTDNFAGYWKYGIYRGPTVDAGAALAVQYANLELSYASLLSRVTKPLYHP